MVTDRAIVNGAQRTTVVVITAWTEPGIEGVRLRVTALPTLAAAPEVSRVTADIDAALDIARRWLRGAGDEPVTTP